MRRIAELRVWLLILAIFAAVCAARPGGAQESATTQSQPEVQPEPIEVDYAGRIDALLAALEQQRVEQHVPGLGIAVVHGDDVLVCAGLGQANIEDAVPATCDTTFAIGSSTKAFTSTLIGMLIDDGKMQWDGHIREYLPGFHLHDADADANVTIRDLLSHRTGLSRMSLLWASGKLTRSEILDAVVNAEPSHDFGKDFNYSNINFIAAGEASARVSGLPWEELLQKRLLDPLGMSDTTVTVDTARAQGSLAVGYMYDDINERFKVDPMRPIDAGAPAGAINSSARDMTKWLQMQLRNGVVDGAQLISQENLQETRSPQITMAPGMQYGLGWMLSKFDGHAVVEHGGNIDGFSAQVAFIPELDLGYVLLMNCSFSHLQAAANAVVLGTLLHDAADTTNDDGPSPEDMQQLVGKYIADFGPFVDARFTVQTKNGALAVDVPGQTLYELKPPDDEGKWYFAITDQIAVSFARNEEGEPIALVMHQGGLDIELPREGVVQVAEVDHAAVREYLGTYHFDPLNNDVKVLIQNGRLAVDVPGQMIYEMHLPDADGRWTFRATDAIQVKFNANDDGDVESMTMYQKDMVFEMPRTGGVDESEDVTLDDVLALQQKAYGGEHLSAINTLRMAGSIRFVNQAVDGRIEILADGLSKYRTLVDLGRAGSITVTVAGDTGWTSSSFDPSDELQGKYLQAVQRQHPLLVAADWRDVMDEVALKEVAERDGRKVYLIRARLGEIINSTVTLDAETGLVVHEDLVMMAPGIGALPMEVQYDDYREVAGIMLPFQIRSENMWQGIAIIEFDSIETNIELAEDAFAAPPDL